MFTAPYSRIFGLYDGGQPYGGGWGEPGSARRPHPSPSFYKIFPLTAGEEAGLELRAKAKV